MTRHIAAMTFLLLTLAAHESSAQDWWSKIPAFPTACYTNDDPFLTDLEKVANELQEAIYKQEETNSVLKAKLDALDAGERQSRMIAFMQKDPAAAQKVMQDVAAIGAQAGEEVQALSEKREALKKKLQEAEAEWEKAQKPLWPSLEEYRGESDPAGNPAKARAAAARYDAGYQKLCPSWFAESGSPFLAYLAAFKQHVENEVTPAAHDHVQTQMLHFTVFGVPGDGFRTVDDLKGIHEYLGEVRNVFNKRLAGPLLGR
jgi:hypothetical protein